MMQWKITVKDHSTRFAWFACIPLKISKFVVHELQSIMGFIGYPFIYHTDNGPKVKGAQILAMLKDINPSILAVTGRVPQPSDQESVKNMQKHVNAFMN